MRIFLLSFLSLVSVVPISASEGLNAYERIATLFDRGDIPEVPSRTQVWAGKCVSKQYPSRPTSGGIAMIVQEEPLIGRFVSPLVYENVRGVNESYEHTVSFLKRYLQNVASIEAVPEKRAWLIKYQNPAYEMLLKQLPSSESDSGGYVGYFPSTDIFCYGTYDLRNRG